MMFLSILLAMMLSGLGRRVAGGAFEQWFSKDIGDYPVRAFFGLTLAFSAWLGNETLAWWVILLVIPAVFFSCSIPNFEGIALGRGEAAGGTSWREDALGLWWHGLIGMAIPAVVVGLCAPWSNWWLFLVAGALIVPAYEVGWQLWDKRVLYYMPNGLKGGSEIGELLWGASCGLCAWGVGF